MLCFAPCANRGPPQDYTSRLSAGAASQTYVQLDTSTMLPDVDQEAPLTADQAAMVLAADTLGPLSQVRWGVAGYRGVS